MQLSTEHILTTHAGSLPRPDDIARMLYDLLDDKPVDQAALDARVRTAIAEVVARQQKIGIDVISDGELGKVGFSNYVLQRMSGFEGHADFMAADFIDAPGVAQANALARSKRNNQSMVKARKVIQATYGRMTSIAR